MTRYPAYKNSGIEWIGQVPSHWNLKRLKYLDKTIMGQSPESTDCNKERAGTPFLQGNADFSGLNPMPSVWCEHPNKLAEKNDILLSVRAPVGAVNVADQPYGIGRGLCAIRSKQSHQKYSYYRSLCLLDELNRIATGSTYTAVSVDQVNNVVIPNPTYEEQELLSIYLDHKTAQMDNLIAKKERMLELLKEERTAVINQAVTKGFDPKVSMKDSGIKWLGKVPKHWKMKRLKYLVFLINQSIEDEISVTTKIDLENLESWTGKIIEIENQNLSVDGMKAFAIGDVLFNKLRPYLAKVYRAQECGVCGGELLVLRPTSLIDSDFLFYRVLSSDFINVVDGSTYGTKMPRASWDFIGNLCIPFPEKSEQVRIAEYLSSFFKKTDLILKKLVSEVEYLKEYRTALISEVVTGKIDVRG